MNTRAAPSFYKKRPGRKVFGDVLVSLGVLVSTFLLVLEIFLVSKISQDKSKMNILTKTSPTMLSQKLQTILRVRSSMRKSFNF